ncbi:UNVERIFIED_ORG: hypothetical protein ABID33_000255 [Xanthobacter viscosus]|uniref:Uncharacterized protein n=1 Tax=Xanthobacter autotrophicus TaxID=280 RepID=A0A6C1KLB7_XANAU|nr:hypothetical protein [Xanthobacter autotrophicus]TLX43854.1 hypothetical protein FBQ73_07065 [Xanthobacter autotrophicus]
MRGVVLKPFPWLEDGMKAEYLSGGEEREFGPHFTGLYASGFVAEVKALPGAPEIQAFQGTPENKSSSAEGAADPEPPKEPVDAAEGAGSVEGTSLSAGAGEGQGVKPPAAAINQGGEAGSAGNAEAAAGAETNVAELSVRHVGRGKWAVYRGDERLTEDALTKEEATSKLAEMQG